MERVHDYCKYMPKDNVLEDLYTNEEFSLVDLPLVVDESFGLNPAKGYKDRQVYRPIGQRFSKSFRSWLDKKLLGLGRFSSGP